MEFYKYLSFEDIISLYPIKEGTLRTFLLNRKKNGLQKAVRKIGKKIYFREDLFIDWIESHA